MNMHYMFLSTSTDWYQRNLDEWDVIVTKMNIAVSPIPGACPYEPPDSLWGLIEKSTPSHEREEIKHMLGEDLVEQSLELHQEVWFR